MLDRLADEPQAQVVRQKLLECQSGLRGQAPGLEIGGRGIGRGAMYELERRLQTRQVIGFAYRVRQ